MTEHNIKSAGVFIAAIAISWGLYLSDAGAQSLGIGGGLGMGGNNGSVGASAGGGGGIGGSIGGVSGANQGSASARLGGGQRPDVRTNFSGAGINFGFGTESGNVPTTTRGITSAFRGLSSQEKQKLIRKCASVMAAPQRYDSDMVALCRVIASL